MWGSRFHALIVATALLSASGCARSLQARAQNWWSVRTPHVHLETDAGRERAVRTAEHLEQLHRGLSTVFWSCGHEHETPLKVRRRRCR